MLKISPLPDILGTLRGAENTLVQSESALVGVNTSTVAIIGRMMSSARFPTIMLPKDITDRGIPGLAVLISLPIFCILLVLLKDCVCS